MQISYFLTFCMLITPVFSFNPFIPTRSLNRFFDTNSKIHSYYDKLGEHKKYFEPNLFSSIDYVKDNYDNIKPEIPEYLGKQAVKTISAVLPHVDSIGHNILHANDVYINSILNNDAIPHDVQKNLILASIKLAQMGDDWGSHLLTEYYNLVDYFL